MPLPASVSAKWTSATFAGSSCPCSPVPPRYEIDADVHISYLGGTGLHGHEEQAKAADVHFALTEAGSGIVHLKIHEPGEYVFYCSVPGHQAAGMEGKLIVTQD